MSGTDDEVRQVAELAKDIRIAMLTTVDDTGHFVSRPMAQQEVEFDGDLWFFAEHDSRKVAQISANPVASVTLGSTDTWISLSGTDTWICLSGTAKIVTDAAKAKQLWNPYVEAWLPQGPEDPSVVLIEFSSDTAEYWDTPGKIATALSFVKAKATGEPDQGGENETVTM